MGYVEENSEMLRFCNKVKTQRGEPQLVFFRRKAGMTEGIGMIPGKGGYADSFAVKKGKQCRRALCKTAFF